MNNRSQNLRLLKMALEGKLSADDLIYKGDPVFDICLDLSGTGHCKAKETYSEKEIQRLKARGLYYDITLNLNA
jgi:hypothetical protein